MEMNTQTLLIIFVALTGVAVLMQACVLLGILLALKKAAKTVTDTGDDLKATVLPLLTTTRELMERLAPQIVTVSEGLAELTEIIHKETKGVRISVNEIMERVSRQTARLDSMLTSGLDTVEHTAEVIETVVAAPVRQVNGIYAAIKAIIDTYRSPLPPRRPTYDPDQDQFV
jgi:methyl-accepting chemotaxis protein